MNSVFISADGKRALSGGNDGKVMLWRAQTGQPIQPIQPIQEWQLTSWITNVAINDAGSLSFASDIIGNATVWQSDTGQSISYLDINRRQMNFSSARFVNNDQQLLTGTP